MLKEDIEQFKILYKQHSDFYKQQLKLQFTTNFSRELNKLIQKLANNKPGGVSPSDLNSLEFNIKPIVGSTLDATADIVNIIANEFGPENDLVFDFFFSKEHDNSSSEMVLKVNIISLKVPEIRIPEHY